MKTLGLLLSTISAPLRRWNVRVLLWLIVALVALVLFFSTIFHELMAAEGRGYSWPTSIYWTLTVMSTLGFGDITFTSDAGRIFSIVVLGTGAVFILVLLPFGFIQFVFAPWMQKRESARAPRELDEGMRGHVVLTQLDAVTDALIERTRQAGIPYVLLVADLDEALRLHDLGYRIMRGDFDDPETYRAARVEHAALVATTRADTTNTNIAFTVRERSPDVPIVATAASEASVDILHLAGCDEVIQLGRLLGEAMARRVLGGDARSHVVGTFADVRIAEASVAGTALVGATLRQLDLRRRFGVNVVGVWQRGVFKPAGPDTRLSDRSVLILAGSDAHLASYDEAHGVEHSIDLPVLILGGGRVGRAAAATLEGQGVPSTIVEKRPDRIRDTARYVHGDAAELDVLHRAGLEEASAALVTTHEDDINVYLTLYCRKLRSELQVIARATRDRNVATLHRAGADAVLSYASVGATAIWNAIGDDRRLVIAEGLEVFQVPVPAAMAGSTLADAQVGERTGCNVVAVEYDGMLEPSPDPDRPLPGGGRLLVIGDEAAERRFVQRYGVGGR